MAPPPGNKKTFGSHLWGKEKLDRKKVHFSKRGKNETEQTDGIPRWPPRNEENVGPFQLSPVENQGQTLQLNSDFPSNQALSGVAHIKSGFKMRIG